MNPTLLVVAKAPVAGFAKTRIGRERGHAQAAEVAAASLLDTLETAIAVGWPVVVAMTGDLHDAARGDEIAAALTATRVVPQRGETFGERLANAHLDADSGHGVVQVGMDSPQVTVDDYEQAGAAVLDGSTVLGPASDGGWWLLGVPRGQDAHVLPAVPMSQDDTGEQTARALGGDVHRLRTLTDLDTWADVLTVADQMPGSHLARAVAATVLA
ncbi:DUF2064 domain-containing protein [Aeromicrobium sp. Leaf350]|uniref:TIGR04282 family arsenosugar biosynthesis glycosyltransferase n=1 Tax=Aeromicrobium sp. Leaf350 TaxID=2876565 RepID=UPI001E2DF0AE|nr:DUF2064 domain-containing protein [Aeromicrobium sp. Leaf350]